MDGGVEGKAVTTLGLIDLLEHAGLRLVVHGGHECRLGGEEIALVSGPDSIGLLLATLSASVEGSRTGGQILYVCNHAAILKTTL